LTGRSARQTLALASPQEETMRALMIGMGLVALSFAAPAGAQELSQITVTANTIEDGDRRAAPAVSRRVQADFVQVAITCQSGSREPDVRRRELETMFGRLKKAVAAAPGYRLAGGELGYSSAPIDTVLFGDVLQAGPAASSFTLTLGVDTKPGESFDGLMARAAAFVTTIDTDGRAEAFLGDEQYLGLGNANTHREALLADIRAEVKTLSDLFSPAIITVTGLEGRVITQPSGPLELEIFIPYSLTLETGRN
jgi:hypothetical protein